jgi:translation initiation factor 5
VPLFPAIEACFADQRIFSTYFEGADDSEKDYIKDALAGKKDDDSLDDDLDGSDDSASLEGGVDDAGAMLLAVEATNAYLVAHPDAKPAEVTELVTNQQMASALKSHDKIYIFVRAAFTPLFFKNKEVDKFAPMISDITKGNKIMERHLISAIEGFCMDKPKNFPVLLKQLYDSDALDEETILEWADEGRSSYTLATVDEEARAILRGEAEPVVVWLQEADTEETTDEED